MIRSSKQSKVNSYVERNQLTSVMNNTQWEELISSMMEIEEFIPQHRLKSIFSDEYVTPWDGEFYYHLRPFEELEWIEIRAELKRGERHIGSESLSAKEKTSALKKFREVLLKCKVPFSLEKGHFRIWGYLRKGTSPAWIQTKNRLLNTFLLFVLFLKSSTSVATGNYIPIDLDPCLSSKPGEKECLKVFTKLYEAVEASRSQPKLYSAVATFYFRRGDMDKVNHYAALDNHTLPLVIANNILFRVSNISQPSTITFPDLLTEAEHREVAENTIKKGVPKVENGKIVFYKSVKKQQLCEIQKSGLNTKFGGISGASDLFAENSKVAERLDRGTQSLAATYDQAAGYSLAFQKSGIEAAILKIVIPVEKVASLNLTTEWEAAWTIVASEIEPQYLWVEVSSGEHKAFDLISNLDCTN